MDLLRVKYLYRKQERAPHLTYKGPEHNYPYYFIVVCQNSPKTQYGPYNPFKYSN